MNSVCVLGSAGAGWGPAAKTTGERNATKTGRRSRTEDLEKTGRPVWIVVFMDIVSRF
jgi:hypothetical protein